MKIALDAQLIYEVQKTGIGRNAQMLIDELVKMPDVTCVLNCFYRRKKKESDALLASYREKGCIINQSKWMPGRIYNHLERIIPVPYSLVFGKKAPITQFFNYTIPFGVRGKKVTFIYDMAYKSRPETVALKTRNWLERGMPKYCKRADRIVTISEFSRQEIHHCMNVPLDRIKIVYCGVDTEKFHNRCSAQDIAAVKEKFGITRDYLLYLGTLEPRKNIESIIEAYSLLKKEKNIPHQLVIAGKKGWLYDSIFALVKQHGLEEDVIFTGYVTDEDARLLLNGAMVFVFPSHYEGFGIPPLEAMACGTPVVTSDTSSLPEVIGDAGIMVKPKDIRGLADGILSILQDENLRARYIEAGYRQVAKFTWENAARQLVEVYKELLEQ